MDLAAVGKFLVFEGALVLAYVALRGCCMRRVPLDAVPRALRHRVALANRLAPALVASAGVAMIAGAVLWSRGV